MSSAVALKTERAWSPQSALGSMGISAIVHGVIALSVVVAVHINWKAAPSTEEYTDMSYEMFDAPPVVTDVVKKVMHSPAPTKVEDVKTKPDDSPKELQDEKSDIAGTQKAVKENSIGSESNGDATATPYYKIKPKYPKAALLAGTEGWVLLNVDINEQGEVESVEVVGGDQCDTFQSEARRAVAQWKYRPFLDNSGKPYRKVGHQVRVDFKLTDNI
jgi:TonB family protein